jgi:glycosyltransferase involved in cell wall biosynthesis
LRKNQRLIKGLRTANYGIDNMRIAITTDSFPIGGVSTSTSILARGICKAGHDADILVTGKPKGYDCERTLGARWPVEYICRGEYWLKRRLEHTLKQLSCYDVVINNHSLETNLVLPSLPARIIRLSVIRSTSNGVISEGRIASPHLDALVGISPEVQRLLQCSRIACRAYMIANAVEVFADALPKLSSPLKIAYLGRLSDIDKNTLILPDIAKYLKEMKVAFSFDIAGEGRDGARLKRKVRSLDIQDSVELIGALPRDHVAGFLCERSFGLFPSNYEGFGLSLVEAMTVGCVPICSDIPAYRWILDKDADLLTVPVGNARAYAERIEFLAANPQLYQEIQARLKRRQQEMFTPEKTVQEYLDLISNLTCSHDISKFEPVGLKYIKRSFTQKVRCSVPWYLLQLVKNSLHLRPN